MTDRELLERAARACGRIPDSWADNAHYIEGVMSGWNPLDDDGDAFRLAVHLGLEIDICRNKVLVRNLNLRSEEEIEEIYRERLDDPWIEDEAQGATRRAITRAAAMMGGES